MKVENLFFLNNKSQKLSARIYKQDEMSLNGMIYCHGMFSSKDGYKITKLAENIVNAGFTLLTFDFSFAGNSEENISELSILQEVDDLNSAFHFFKQYGMREIHITGSSLGGLVALLFSSVMGNAVSTQTLVATPVILEELFFSMLKTNDVTSLREEDYTEVDGKQIRNKFFKEAAEINIAGAINNTLVPTLVIHGSDDEVVSANNAIVLIKLLNCKKRIILIEGGDHNLSRDSDLKILSENMLEWMKVHN